MDPEEVGQESPTEEVVDNSQEETTTETANETEGGFNPAWEPFRQTLGFQFESIRPELAKIDKNYHDHITKVNGQYAPWKDFDTQGITPQQVTDAFSALQQMNANPEALYEKLGQFLKENGRLPETAAETAQVQQEAQAAQDEYQSDEARQIAELKQQFEDSQRLLQEQVQQAQQEAAEKEALDNLNKEYDALTKAHPDLTERDLQEIAQRHFYYANVNPGNIPALDVVAQEYLDFVNSIRSAPRPNDTAPRLPGAGGAAPAPATKDPSEFSSRESQDAIVAMLRQAQSQ